MRVKILKDGKYGDCGKHVDVSKGDLCELPEFVANVWLKDGRCELPGKKSPVEETKVVNPVKEVKTPTKKKKESKK